MVSTLSPKLLTIAEFYVPDTKIGNDGLEQLLPSIRMCKSLATLSLMHTGINRIEPSLAMAVASHQALEMVV